MTKRTRKLIGTLILVPSLIVYTAVAMVIAAARLPEASQLVQWTYFVVAGLIWVLPAGALIGWMQRP